MFCSTVLQWFYVETSSIYKYNTTEIKTKKQFYYYYCTINRGLKLSHNLSEIFPLQHLNCVPLIAVVNSKMS